MRISRVLQAGAQHNKTDRLLVAANIAVRAARAELRNITQLANDSGLALRAALHSAVQIATANLRAAERHRERIYRARWALRSVARIESAPNWQGLTAEQRDRLISKRARKVNWHAVLAPQA